MKTKLNKKLQYLGLLALALMVCGNAWAANSEEDYTQATSKDGWYWYMGDGKESQAQVEVAPSRGGYITTQPSFSSDSELYPVGTQPEALPIEADAITYESLGGDVIMDAGETPVFTEKTTGSTQEDSLSLVNVINETAVTSTLRDSRYARPEVIVIDNRIFFAFQDAAGFKLVELNEDLSYKSSVYDLFAGPEELSPHDIRLATDGTKLWYAFETVNDTATDTCKGHFLNIAKYDISGEPILEKYKINITKPVSGCGTSRDDYLNPIGVIPTNPEAVDDPAPIYYNGKYVVLTRAWMGSTIQHIRTFDQEFNIIEDFTLDLGPITGNRMLSQNALVDVEAQLYLIGGLSNGSPGNQNFNSDIYAIPLTNDLHSVAGDMILLVKHPDKNYGKVNAARYKDGKLYINYAEVINQEQFHHLGVFDVENNFASITQIQFQDVSFETNHASIEVLGNRVYVFYNEGPKTGYFDVLGQVFEWSDDNSYDADGFMWGTETYYTTTGDTVDIQNKIDVISNHLKTKHVKIRLFVQNVYDYSTREFKPIVCGPSQAQPTDSFNLDEFVAVFKENGWSMHPMLSPDTIKGVLSDTDMNIYVEFVEWFLDRYKEEANIEYIELINNPVRNWQGSVEKLVETTNRIYEQIKRDFPDIMIGTPGFEYPQDKGDAATELVEYYLDKSNGAKFDYWAFHGYSPWRKEGDIWSIYPPTKTGEHFKYLGIAGIAEIRKKLNENSWQNRKIIDTEHVISPPSVDITTEGYNLEAAHTIQELVLKRTLKADDEFALLGVTPLKIASRTSWLKKESDWGSLHEDGSLTKTVNAVNFLWSKLNEYHYDSHRSGTWDVEDEVWIEKFKTVNKELYIFFKPFEYHEGSALKLDGKILTYELNLGRNPSLIILTDNNDNVTIMPPAQGVILEAENAPKFLEVIYYPLNDAMKDFLTENFGISDWNNIETICEGTDDIYIYKFTKYDDKIGRTKQIWVVWDDTPDYAQSGYGLIAKKVTITGIEHNLVKITEAVPDYEAGRDVPDYYTAFKTWMVTTAPTGGVPTSDPYATREVTIGLGETPLFIEENYPPRRR